MEKKDRAEERTRRRAARDCRGEAGRVRVTLRRMCTPTCDLFCSETLHIGGEQPQKTRLCPGIDTTRVAGNSDENRLNFVAALLTFVNAA